MHKVYLSLGSNIGDKVDYLDKAVEIFRKNPDIHRLKVSSYYATDPVGYLDQDAFVNIALAIETTMIPLDLLDFCQEIEMTLNRVRIMRWGPRTIDVDIVLYDDLEIQSERLEIPHPRMRERGFVLIPLREIAPDLVIQGMSIEALIEQLPPDGVRKIENGKKST